MVSFEYATNHVEHTGSMANLQLVREASPSLGPGEWVHCCGWRNLVSSQQASCADRQSLCSLGISKICYRDHVVKVTPKRRTSPYYRLELCYTDGTSVPVGSTHTPVPRCAPR